MVITLRCIGDNNKRLNNKWTAHGKIAWMVQREVYKKHKLLQWENYRCMLHSFENGNGSWLDMVRSTIYWKISVVLLRMQIGQCKQLIACKLIIFYYPINQQIWKRKINLGMYLPASGHRIIRIKWRVANKHFVHDCTQWPPANIHHSRGKHFCGSGF